LRGCEGTQSFGFHFRARSLLTACGLFQQINHQSQSALMITRKTGSIRTVSSGCFFGMGRSFREMLVSLELVKKRVSLGVPGTFNQPLIVVVPGGEQWVCKDRISGTALL